MRGGARSTVSSVQAYITKERTQHHGSSRHQAAACVTHLVSAKLRAVGLRLCNGALGGHAAQAVALRLA